MAKDFPNVTLNIIPADQISGVADHRALIVGQMISTGSATAGELQREIGNTNEEDALFDATSHIAGMIRDFKVENKITTLDALPLEDGPSAQKATAIFGFTGTATADATVYVTLFSKEKYRYEIAIENGDTQTDVGAKVLAAFAVATKKPFTLANSTGTVTATATNGGTLANNWGISFEGTIPGVTVAVTGWTGGTVDPILTGVLDAIGNTRYQTIVWPAAYDLDEVQTLLDARFNTTNQILDGRVIQVKHDTLANLKTYLRALNSQSVVVPVNRKITNTLYKASATFESEDTTAAQIAAIRALRLTEDASLSNYITTAASSDQFGGVAIATLPYANTSMPNMPVANIGDEFSEIELNELLADGGSIYGANRTYTGTIFGQFVTTYKTDNAGNEDDSFKYLNTIDASSIIRETFFTNFKSTYAQSRLTNGDLVAGRDMTNAADIRAFANEIFDNLADDALVQRGVAAKSDFNTNMVVTVDVRNGQVAFTIAPLLVSQLRAIIGTIQINFGG